APPSRYAHRWSGRSSAPRAQARARCLRFRRRARTDQAGRAAAPTTCAATRAVRAVAMICARLRKKGSTASSPFAELLAGRVPVEVHDVVVYHADRLHEGIDDGRPDELESARQQLLRYLLRYRGLVRHLLGRAEMIDLRLTVHEVPQQRRKAVAVLHDFKP